MSLGVTVSRRHPSSSSLMAPKNVGLKHETKPKFVFMHCSCSYRWPLFRWQELIYRCCWKLFVGFKLKKSYVWSFSASDHFSNIAIFFFVGLTKKKFSRHEEQYSKQKLLKSPGAKLYALSLVWLADNMKCHVNKARRYSSQCVFQPGDQWNYLSPSLGLCTAS